jgi:hypothetical protein
MRPLKTLLAVMLTVFSLAGCQAMTGKTAGQNVDDAALTTSVKTKLAADKLSSLTRVDVDTNNGTVSLNGGGRVFRSKGTSSGTRLTGKRRQQSNQQYSGSKEVKKDPLPAHKSGE